MQTVDALLGFVLNLGVLLYFETRWLKDEWGRKLRPSFALFDSPPVKLRKGLARCRSEYFAFGQGPNLCHTCDGALFDLGDIEPRGPVN